MNDRATAETDFCVHLKNEVGIESFLREVGALRAETKKRFKVLERMMRSDRVRAEIPVKSQAARSAHPELTFPHSVQSKRDSRTLS